MNKIPYKQIHAVLVVILTAVTVSHTSAKYVNESSYNIKATCQACFTEKTEDFTFTVDKAGYYAIVLKGGDGGPGVCYENGAYTGVIPGGLGGIVTGYTYLKAGDKLVTYLGTAGGYPTISESVGTPGNGGTTNYNGDGFGGNGSTAYLSDTVTDHKDVNKEPASSGGGAASYIVYEGKVGKDVLFVAGGGGGGASWNKQYSNKEYVDALYYEKYHPEVKFSDVFGLAVPSGTGGAGGSTITVNSTYNNTFISSETSVYNAFSYNGENGNDPISTDGIERSGMGATHEKGDGGLDTNFPGDYGKAHWSGTGGNANKKTAGSLGGGGGAGYAGGGAGSGSSFTNSAGGGGGGSSYRMETTNDTPTGVLPSEISQYMINNCSTIYKTNYMTNRMSGTYTTAWLDAPYKNGFVMIMYLGDSVPT